jgi:hypothetical protein
MFQQNEANIFNQAVSIYLKFKNNHRSNQKEFKKLLWIFYLLHVLFFILHMLYILLLSPLCTFFVVGDFSYISVIGLLQFFLVTTCTSELGA